MSTIQFTLPAEYGYVLLATTSTFILSIIHGFNTVSHRRTANIPFPTAYATDEVAAASPPAYAFNCAQRAHANYLENQPSVIAALLVAGLQYPVTSALLGAAWVVNRWVFMIGYSRADWGAQGKGRLRGAGCWLAQFALFGLSAAVGVNMVRA